MRTTLSAAEIDGVFQPFERAVPLPRRAYVDRDLFAFERAEIFGKRWVCVARTEDVSAPGQRIVVPLTPAGVLVMRGVDLELRAFHNTCLHRCLPLVLNTGRGDQITCPYHGWVYDSLGRLASAPHAPACVRDARPSLGRVRVATWEGFVFVSLDDDGPSLLEALGDVPPWLTDAAPSSLVRVHEKTFVTRGNWKLIVENFQESHHFPTVHPALERLTPAAAARSWGGDGPWLGGVMEVHPSFDTVSTTGTSLRRAVSRAGTVFDAMLFPGLLTSLQPDYLLTYRLWPLGPTETRVTFDILVHPASAGPLADHADLVFFWDRVNDEDREIVERQALGMASPGPDPIGYSLVEDGVHAFDRLVAGAHGGTGP